MPKLTRLSKNLITKSNLLSSPSTPGYVEITANMLRRNQNLADLTDKAEARKNLDVIGVGDLDAGPTADTVPVRTSTGTLKAADGTETNDLVTKYQLDNATFGLDSANITGVLPPSKGGLGSTSIDGARNALGLHTVATSGNYNDLINRPNLSTVATSGNYNDLLNKPNLKTVATSGRYEDLTINGSASYTPAPMPTLVSPQLGYFPRVQNGLATSIEGCIVTAFPFLDGKPVQLGYGGSWLIIKFAPYNVNGYIVPKLIHYGSDMNSDASGIGIVPGDTRVNTNVGMFMAIKL